VHELSRVSFINVTMPIDAPRGRHSEKPAAFAEAI
jgi:hypothetical protein